MILVNLGEICEVNVSLLPPIIVYIVLGFSLAKVLPQFVRYERDQRAEVIV